MSEYWDWAKGRLENLEARNAYRVEQAFRAITGVHTPEAESQKALLEFYEHLFGSRVGMMWIDMTGTDQMKVAVAIKTFVESQYGRWHAGNVIGEATFNMPMSGGGEGKSTMLEGSLVATASGDGLFLNLANWPRSLEFDELVEIFKSKLARVVPGFMVAASAPDKAGQTPTPAQPPPVEPPADSTVGQGWGYPPGNPAPPSPLVDLARTQPQAPYPMRTYAIGAAIIGVAIATAWWFTRTDKPKPKKKKR